MINPSRAALPFFFFGVAVISRSFLNNVETVAGDSTAFTLSTGYGVQASRTPYPPLQPAPSTCATASAGHRMILNGKAVIGARNYDQSTQHLGAPSNGRVDVALRRGACMNHN